MGLHVLYIQYSTVQYSIYIYISGLKLQKHSKRIMCAKGLSRRKDYSELVDMVEFNVNRLQYTSWTASRVLLDVR